MKLKKVHWYWYVNYVEDACSKDWTQSTQEPQWVTCENCISRMKKFDKQYA